MSEASVLARHQGRIGRITLDRPKALNALTRDMVAAISAALVRFEDDPAVHAVVLEGNGRAFCAGGDIRAIRSLAMDGDHAGVHAFFAEEYALNRRIAEYPKPVVSLIQGACLGGGIGLSVHGQIRVVTEGATLAMPETAIALFPDVGTTFVLPRLRGAFGMYMALTGARATADDAAWVGLATHVVAGDAFARLADDLARDGLGVLPGTAVPPRGGAFAAIEAQVNHCFGAGSVAEIAARLAADGSEWARTTLSTLRSMSPSSVLWTFRIVRDGANRTLPQCLAAELALTAPVVRHPDFAEGVRAMVVDKDRAPRWSPGRIEDVDHAHIAAMFDRTDAGAWHG